ncbi:enolase [Brochothrix campestris FSL F6-1037]|uniref:Enolase n=1 Tax=Brochothrix campestris FSL F6-1037 TaxID=1265861 RepID=W7CR06_9LIST|nr:YutD family protein [Brochothrix campestris]EUJ35393.1 enolase [Brochothrix campestris FSL F6-1037]
MLMINGQPYEVVRDYREGFQEEMFLERYSEVLKKYDYIVGDWGYEKLRLKGFFEDNNKKANFDARISTLNDYLYEYCNFGCAHFVLKKLPMSMAPAEPTIPAEVTEPVTETVIPTSSVNQEGEAVTNETI